MLSNCCQGFQLCLYYCSSFTSCSISRWLVVSVWLLCWCRLLSVPLHFMADYLCALCPYVCRCWNVIPSFWASRNYDS